MVQEIVPRDHSFMAQGEPGTVYLNMFSPGGSQSQVVGSHTCIFLMNAERHRHLSQKASHVAKSVQSSLTV